jgi:hypothetical protein
MSGEPAEDLVCVDDTHYLHVGDNPDTGRPCNSSVSPSSLRGLCEPGWRCLGCNSWWRRMPEAAPLGLAALAMLRQSRGG